MVTLERQQGSHSFTSRQETKTAPNHYLRWRLVRRACGDMSRGDMSPCLAVVLLVKNARTGDRGRAGAPGDPTAPPFPCARRVLQDRPGQLGGLLHHGLHWILREAPIFARQQHHSRCAFRENRPFSFSFSLYLSLSLSPFTPRPLMSQSVFLNTRTPQLHHPLSPQQSRFTPSSPFAFCLLSACPARFCTRNEPTRNTQLSRTPHTLLHTSPAPGLSSPVPGHRALAPRASLVPPYYRYVSLSSSRRARL